MTDREQLRYQILELVLKTRPIDNDSAAALKDADTLYQWVMVDTRNQFNQRNPFEPFGYTERS